MEVVFSLVVRLLSNCIYSRPQVQAERTQALLQRVRVTPQSYHKPTKTHTSLEPTVTCGEIRLLVYTHKWTRTLGMGYTPLQWAVPRTERRGGIVFFVLVLISKKLETSLGVLCVNYINNAQAPPFPHSNYRTL